MMGGGSGGGVPSSSVNEVLAAAEGRLRKMASEASRILIACVEEDRAALDGLLDQHGPFSGIELRVVSVPAVAIDTSVAWANWVVVFTADAKDVQALDHVIETCLQLKKAGIHVKSKTATKIPSRVSAYRWRSISWAEFVGLITPST
jgi:hypothetical protein